MVAETPPPAAAGAIVAVGEAKTAGGATLPAADLEGLKQLVTQTRAIGVILPPPDIRAIVDKTAQFVARNGALCGVCACRERRISCCQPDPERFFPLSPPLGIEFEKRILANEAQNVKFNFLNPADPYHAFYRMRVSRRVFFSCARARRRRQQRAAAFASRACVSPRLNHNTHTLTHAPPPP